MGMFERLPLTHSWPLTEQGLRFDLGCILNSVIADAIPPFAVGEVGIHHAGCWECDLANDRLTWSGGVFDLFGLPRDARLTRDQAVALYAEESRAKMEQLRAYAIRHRRGFTLDTEIRPVVGGRRRMRLICAPVCEGDRPVRLHGLKLLI